MTAVSRRTIITAGLGAVALAGCDATPAPSATPTPQETAVGFTNPVWDSNFADPMIMIDADQTAWAYATNGNGAHVQTLRSTDLVTWEQADDALPQVASWSQAGKTWAPEVARFADDRFLLYYTTIGPDPSLQSVSVAVADTLAGPFRDTSKKPLVFESDAGGSIDASPFRATDGTRYLYWKNDGNAVGADTWISVAELSADGLSLAGSPKKLIKQDQAWEGQLVEAPFCWERDGMFHLFYSANSFASADYAVGHAVGKAPTGPFTKDPDPILVSDDVAAGPGHCALFDHGGRTWMVYHAWAPDAIGSDPPGRMMWLSEVSFDGAKVTVVPPTTAYPTRP